MGVNFTEVDLTSVEWPEAPATETQNRGTEARRRGDRKLTCGST